MSRGGTGSALGAERTPRNPVGERNEDGSPRRRLGRGSRQERWSLRGCPGSRNEEERKQGQEAEGIEPGGWWALRVGVPVVMG